MLAKYLARAKGSGKVRIDDVAPLRFRHAERGRALDLSGTVDEDIDFRKTLQRGGQQCFERRTVAHIGAKAQSPAPSLFNLDRRLIHVLSSPVGSNDVGSRIGKPHAER